jgi:hypothetical protein
MRVRRLEWATEVAAIMLMGCGASAVTCLGCSDGSEGKSNGHGGGAATAGSSGTSGASGEGTGGSSGGGGASGSGTGGSGGKGNCEGDRVVNNDAAFDALVAEGCTVITGDLRISRITYASLNGLQTLTSVGQDLELTNVGLTSLGGLQNLTAIGGALTIANTDVTALTELANVDSIGTTLGITLNDSLARLGPLLDWPSDATAGLIAISFNAMLPQCEVEAFDAAQVNSACNDVSCSSNGGTGTCP